MSGQLIHHASKYEAFEYPLLDESTQCFLCGISRQLDSCLCLECEDKMNAQEKERLMYECE